MATTVAGTWTDHRGPRRPLLFSLVLFALAQIASGLAPSMEVLLAARALSGIAEGGLDIALVVLVSDLMPEALRAKVFAAFATAWIVPSLVGPAVAGGIAQWLGWRAAFLLPLIMLIAVVPALLPALRRATARGAREWSASERATVRAAALVAGAIAMLTWGTSAGASGEFWGSAGAAAALFVIAVRLAHVLPAGSLRGERGAPALVLATLLVSLAFSALGSYLPLLLATVRGASPAIAGVTLTITGIFWAVGSNVSSRDAVRARFSPGQVAAAGMAVMTLGGFGPLLLALDVVSLTVAMGGWALAATGMGLVNNTLAVHLTVLVPDEERGRYLAGRTVAAAVGVAGATALGGALVAREADHLTAWPITITVAAGILAALITIPLARRVDVV